MVERLDDTQKVREFDSPLGHHHLVEVDALQRTLAVHTTWRSGATALSWAVAATYGRSFLCEPLYCPQFVLQPDPFPKEFLDDHGMVDPTQIRDRTDGLRFCPASAVPEEDVEFVIELLAFLRSTIPDVVITKTIGTACIADRLAVEGELTIHQCRGFLQQLGSFLRQRWPVAKLVSMHASRDIASRHQPEPLLECLERIERFPLGNEATRAAAKLWVVHGYHSLAAEGRGTGTCIWIDGCDLDEVADLIRSHLGGEDGTHGTLEDNLRQPRGWVPHLEAMGQHVHRWWRPTGEIEYNYLVPLAERLGDELSEVDDPIVLDLASRVVMGTPGDRVHTGMSTRSES